MHVDSVHLSDAYLEEAERILLPFDHSFDEERRIFIRNLQTIDLQAVPGSGKTTALLAKLFILDKFLPFENGSGILVISHTNAAVDEIKNRIGDKCSKILRYPSFIGTIQGFVDEFLAKPYYSMCFDRKIYKIDNGIYDETAARYYDNMYNPAKLFLEKKYNGKELFQSLRFDLNFNLTKGLTKDIFLPSSSKSKTYNILKQIKLSFLQNGILHFDDAYFLAQCYIKDYPYIKKILQHRFKYVFVDEMQDMSMYQHEILEDVFYDEGKSVSVYQRIGDKNQAIYGNEVQAESCWIDREQKLNLQGSHRLTSNIADVVKYFGLDYLDIKGYNDNPSSIKPHIIIYDDDTRECKVIKKFVSIVDEIHKTNSTDLNFTNPVKAIAWRKDSDDERKFSLRSYCPKFESETIKPKVFYDKLESYFLFYDKTKPTLVAIRKNILNAIIHILRLEEIKDNNDRYYTKKNLLKFLKENREQEYEDFQLKMYKWCIDTIKGNIDSALVDIRTYIQVLIQIIDSSKTYNKSRIFVESASTQQVFNIENNVEECSECYLNNKKIEINTIHSVKGETHFATLYMESFYDRGYGNYESERLRNQFKKQKVTDSLDSISTSHDKIVQSAKMAYVGFSRPTHLLCFAVHKDRFERYLSDIDSSCWDIIDLTEGGN